ncbi:MAG TPA: D-2-hydroxyacid dehydrogenase [Polyangiales bacterium]|nr:D-2-hydroxyacid dehydrogenase [Polyangiales bacterium]
MPNPQVVAINAPLSDALLSRIAHEAEPARVLRPEQLKQDRTLLRQAEVLFTHAINPERLREAGQLRWIQTAGAGVEWLLTPEIVARQALTITNASGVHADQIAEHVFALLLALIRRLPLALAQQREQRWDSAPFVRDVPLLAGSTLGILGVGAIGERVAELGAAFHMRVLGLRRASTPVPHVERMYPPESLHELLRESDYVVNALPLTAATRKLISAAELQSMRSNAVLINIGRGGTQDTDALVAALSEGRIAGAGLDVTDPEPLPPEHPLWHSDRVIITPHFSGGRPGYFEHVTDIFLDNLRRYRAGETLRNVVDRAAGY